MSQNEVSFHCENVYSKAENASQIKLIYMQQAYLPLQSNILHVPLRGLKKVLSLSLH
jgi:hypothetical protein